MSEVNVLNIFKDWLWSSTDHPLLALDLTLGSLLTLVYWVVRINNFNFRRKQLEKKLEEKHKMCAKFSQTDFEVLDVACQSEEAMVGNG